MLISLKVTMNMLFLQINSVADMSINEYIADQGRLIWLDWMKVWAILSIIWGHFLSEGHLYLYVYNVQVFCVISGFLYKRPLDWNTCLKKSFCQLFVPTVIMSVLMQLEASVRCLALGEDYEISWIWFFQWLILGHRWCMGPCWYFYSLIIMRMIMQAIPERKWVYTLLFFALSAGAICLHSAHVEISNANTNVLVCMPFFLIGFFLKPLKEKASHLHNYALELGLLFVAVVLIVLCGNYNGYVWMYLCEYGNSYILYIIGGLAGTLFLYIISLWLSRVPYRNMVLLLSRGSILIIGLHIVVVRRLTELPDRMWGEDLFFAFLILFCFIPIIRLAELFFPILLGRR